MPSRSKRQFRFMAAASANPAFAKKVGISTKVAKEFHAADRGQSYKKLPEKKNVSRRAAKQGRESDL